MSDVKWIKITTDIFDNEKILLIENLPEADSIIVIWFKLLCLAGKMNNSGVFMLNDKIAYTDKMLATIFRRKETTVQLALKTFEQFGMVEIVDGVVTVPNWGKHQNLDQLESKKEYMKGYMQAYRKKQKALVEGKPNCKTNSKANSKANVSSADKDIDIDLDLEKNSMADKPPRVRFVPPTLEEVEAYCVERKNGVNPASFFDFYSANGWKQGKGKPIVDWKAAVRTWERRGTGEGQRSEPAAKTFDPETGAWR